MARSERADLWYLRGLKCPPDLTVEVRPDKKRLVIRRNDEVGENTGIWIDVTDVKALTDLLTSIVTELSFNHVVKDDDDD